jgi:hypothetical protein
MHLAGVTAGSVITAINGKNTKGSSMAKLQEILGTIPSENGVRVLVLQME